jgi:hypothetical protein
MKRKILLCLLSGILVLSVGLSALAQSGGGYDLAWSSIDGGGGVSTGGGYTLAGTAGQPDGGALAGGSYHLGGGFWLGGQVVANLYAFYLPAVMRSYP